MLPSLGLGWPPPCSMKAATGHMQSFSLEAGPMADATLGALQQEITMGLQELLSGEIRLWAFPPPLAFVVHRVSVAGEKKTRLTAQWEGGEEREVILRGVLILLLQAGDILKACAECHKPFVAVKRQIYCGQVGSQRVQNRKRPKIRKRG